ncbi:MAG: hypothetical protein RJB66_305 [Pseudomonadota bacterium]
MNVIYFKNKIAFGLLMFLPLVTWAGEATLSGYSEMYVPAEFVSVSVRVTSECYVSAQGVSVANDEVASKVLQVLKSLAVTSAGDEVKATGGFVQRYTGYNPTTGKNICINNFRKMNQIVFKSKDITNFPGRFAEIQDRLYSLGMETDPNHLEKPTSFLEIGEPGVGISLAQRQEFENQALVLALNDAKEKFEKTLSIAGIDKYKIINYTDGGIIPRRIDDDARRSVAAPPPAPVELADILISKSVTVRFEYSGGSLNL